MSAWLSWCRRWESPMPQKSSKLCTADVELALYAHLGGSQAGICIPNVRNGLFDDRHEADLVRLTSSGFFEEYELKISGSDIVRDSKKRNGLGHARHRYVSRLWFVVPEPYMHDPLIPKFAGIISFRVEGKTFLFKTVRAAPLNPNRMQPKPSVLTRFFKLACYRVWSLKQHLQKLRGGSFYTAPTPRRRRHGRRY